MSRIKSNECFPRNKNKFHNDHLLNIFEPKDSYQEGIGGKQQTRVP